MRPWPEHYLKKFSYETELAAVETEPILPGGNGRSKICDSSLQRKHVFIMTHYARQVS